MQETVFELNRRIILYLGFIFIRSNLVFNLFLNLRLLTLILIE
jgi:hypothetical protein